MCVVVFPCLYLAVPIYQYLDQFRVTSDHIWTTKTVATGRFFLVSSVLDLLTKLSPFVANMYSINAVQELLLEDHVGQRQVQRGRLERHYTESRRHGLGSVLGDCGSVVCCAPAGICRQMRVRVSP